MATSASFLYQQKNKSDKNMTLPLFSDMAKIRNTENIAAFIIVTIHITGQRTKIFDENFCEKLCMKTRSTKSKKKFVKRISHKTSLCSIRKKNRPVLTENKQKVD